MANILFVCSRNKWRSLTAERIFSGIDGIFTSSAGTSNDAEHLICIEDIEWADAIFVMEKKHLSILKKAFGDKMNDVKTHCLNISDQYRYMDKSLVDELETKFAKYAALYSR